MLRIRLMMIAKIRSDMQLSNNLVMSLHITRESYSRMLCIKISNHPQTREWFASNTCNSFVPVKGKQGPGVSDKQWQIVPTKQTSISIENRNKETNTVVGRSFLRYSVFLYFLNIFYSCSKIILVLHV